MATTTNFGWETPDDTDLVKDGAAAIRTALGGVDTSFVDLKGGTTGQVLKKATNTDLDFVWSADSAGMNNPLTTTGDTIYSSSGSTPARLGIGSTGQVLTVSGGLPVWATASGGAIKQVVTATYATAVSTAGTQVDTGLTATITPSSTSNKILVFVSIPGNYFSVSTTATSADMTYTLVRGATDIFYTNIGGYLSISGGAGKEIYTPQSFMKLDSPSTTSATTYKVTIQTGQSVTTGYTNANATTPITMTLMEI